MYEGMGHGNSFWRQRNLFEEANLEMINWFDKYLLNKLEP